MIGLRLTRFRIVWQSCCVCTTWLTCANVPNAIEVSVALDQTNYFVGEPIQWSITATNNSDEELHLRFPTSILYSIAFDQEPIKSCGGSDVVRYLDLAPHEVASVSGTWPDVSGAAYQASKLGMIGLARAAGFEEHENGVRFSTILPGIIDTPILDNRPEPPPREVRDASLKPEDVAEACRFLATLPPHVSIPELTMLPTQIQALGKSSVASPKIGGK